MEEYKEAIKSSLYDEKWIYNLYKNKNTICEFLKPHLKNPKKAFVEFLKTSELQPLLEGMKTTCLDEKAARIIFEAGKSETTIMIIENLIEKTENDAHIVKLLLNEYMNINGNFFDAEIKPFPENIDETTSFIRTFNIKTNNDTFYVRIKDTGLDIANNTEINEYFDSRTKNKAIKKRYVHENDMTNQEYRNIVRKLISLKEAEIPCQKLHLNSNDCPYKVVYRGNQTVIDENKEIKICKENIKIRIISKS